MSIFPPRGLYLTLFFQLELESTSRGSVQTANLQCPASSKHTVHCEVPKLAKLFLHRVLCIYLSNNFKPHVFLSISPSHRLKFISLSISCAYNCSSNDDLCSHVMAHLPKHCHKRKPDQSVLRDSSLSKCIYRVPSFSWLSGRHGARWLRGDFISAIVFNIWKDEKGHPSSAWVSTSVPTSLEFNISFNLWMSFVCFILSVSMYRSI